MAEPDLTRVLDVIRAEVGDAPLDADTHAADLRAWDSVAMVNVLFSLEEAFGVQFSSAQMERAEGVASLLQILREAQAKTR
jgi:acyl carrier protein